LILIALIIIGLSACFGEKIGDLDLNLGYGRIIKKLKILLADIDELKALLLFIEE